MKHVIKIKEPSFNAVARVQNTIVICLSEREGRIM